MYRHDYVMAALWKHPEAILKCGARAVVEPNFSTYEDQPPVVAAYEIYRKRKLACWWGSHGVKIIVDMNVEPKFYAINFAGVPEGWRSFATKCNCAGAGVPGVLDDARAVRDFCGTDDFLLLVVGGGRKMARICAEKGWLWSSAQRADRAPRPRRRNTADLVVESPGVTAAPAGESIPPWAAHDERQEGRVGGGCGG